MTMADEFLFEAHLILSNGALSGAEHLLRSAKESTIANSLRKSCFREKVLDYSTWVALKKIFGMNKFFTPSIYASH